MIEEIAADLYRIEIPLPKNPLKALNSYVIKDSERSLIVDTGMNREECMRAMRESLKMLGVDLEKTDFFITHSHVDHVGLVGSLKTEGSAVYSSGPEIDNLDRRIYGSHWTDIINFTRMCGFPEDELQRVLHNHPAYKYDLEGPLSFRILEDGDELNIGDYEFKCIGTPGHSEGHMCLYEPHKMIFVAGDHILDDITPVITLRSDDRNPLKEYLSSLEKVYEIEIELVLPGHRSIFRNCKDRIKELKNHHQKRVDEVISILGEGTQNAYQVASQMTWDITYDSWDLYPVIQKWFAVGEAIAHLKYIEEKGITRKEIKEQKIIYSLKNK